MEIPFVTRESRFKCKKLSIEQNSKLYFPFQSIVPIIAGHAPAGASLKQLFHYGQLIRSRRFCQYDHGMNRNLRIYDRATPPDYNLKNCTAKVAIIYADEDTLATTKDAKRLSKELPNVFEVHRVNDDTFNHVDFIWASDVKELVYDYITDWMKAAENRNISDVK